MSNLRLILTGINHMDARIALGQLQITGAGPLEESLLLQLDPIQLAPSPGAGQTDGRIDIQIEGEIRSKITEHRLLDLADQLLVDAATTALIGQGGEIMAIADHPVPLLQRRLNASLHQLNPGGIHQQQLGLDGQWLIVDLFDDGAHPLGQRRTARLARLLDLGDPLLTQPGLDVADRRALAGPFQPFNDNEFCGHQDRP